IVIVDVLCNQLYGSLKANVSGGISPYSYVWSNSATTQSINNLHAGNFSVVVKDANACSITKNTVVKDSMNTISLNLGKDTSFCPGNQLVLDAGTGFSSYLWQNNSTSSKFTVTTTGTYYVKVTDKDGCNKSDTIKIVVDCSDVYFPTAFTPNNDGLNDTFGAIGNISAITIYTLNVYDRWGQLIFSSNNPFVKWNGKQNGIDSDLGSYVWTATYSINNKPVITKKGNVILLR
ncbi:MAG: gliding motility-associated C-terminal domain-containing protein, partial [Chitinophagaceae bacterium]|nr:gliding motility-associated C-terminal domain-containing protein [Chitinophagaceae bacterium]